MTSWSRSRHLRRQVRDARSEAEIAWFHGEAAIVKKAFDEAAQEQFEKARAFMEYLASPSPYAPGSERGTVPDLESHHEKFLDKWRVGVTVVLVVALFIVVVIIVGPRKSNTAAAPYVSLFSGLAGIALGWMFANATGGSANRGTVGPLKGHKTVNPPGEREHGTEQVKREAEGGHAEGASV